MSGPRTIEK